MQASRVMYVLKGDNGKITCTPLAVKPGKHPKDPLSYRPISLTSCICKLMKEIINSSLMCYLETNGHNLTIDNRGIGRAGTPGFK